MKKYLLLGFAALAFVSCSKDNFSSTDGVPAGYQDQNAKTEKYATAFKNAFGVTTVNENVNWGFSPVAVQSMNEHGVTITNAAKAFRRAANVNRNEWGTGEGKGGYVNIPANVTSDERTLVYNYFNKKREGATNQNNINWQNFFVSQVWKGTTQYTAGNGGTVIGSNQMNHLQCLKTEGGTIDEWGNLQGDWEHINDFNDANQTTEWTGNGTIKGHTFMEMSGTWDFAYLNSTDSKYHNEYIIIPGAEISPSLAGYYYVGFDFYATHPIGQEANTNMDVDRDWFFTDWIVRISPAEIYLPGGMRIMAEDLIASSLTNVDKSDLDFNDVVFDVKVGNEYLGEFNGVTYNSNMMVAQVILRAAGGTMPIYIGQKDEQYEVHNLFGVDTKCMVNTNARAYANAPYSYKDGVAPVKFKVVLGQADYNHEYNYADFPIYVGDELLVAPLGQVTHKLCVPTTTRWMNEKTIITTGYPKFSQYVESGAPAEWYTTVGTGLYE